MRVQICLFALLVLSISSMAMAADKIDVSGEWEITIATGQGTFTPTADFKQDGEKLTGTYKGRFGEAKLEGAIKEKDIAWKVTINAQGQALQLDYTGTVESEAAMKGKVELGDFGSGEWTAKRKQKDK